MLIKNVVLSVFLIFSLGACMEPTYDSGKLKVIEVTDHDFKINDESAVTLIVGHANVAEYSFSLRKSDLKKVLCCSRCLTVIQMCVLMVHSLVNIMCNQKIMTRTHQLKL